MNNYIDWDQSNELYDPNWMEKSIKNVDVVTRKLGLTSTRATNQKLEVAREEKQKKEEIMEK